MFEAINGSRLMPVILKDFPFLSSTCPGFCFLFHKKLCFNVHYSINEHKTFQIGKSINSPKFAIGENVYDHYSNTGIFSSSLKLIYAPIQIRIFIKYEFLKKAHDFKLYLHTLSRSAGLPSDSIIGTLQQ